MSTITTKHYTTLDQAFGFFNQRLWDGKLPPCLITLQRKRNAYGYFHAKQFRKKGEDQEADEIALNPNTFLEREDRETLSTLVHEMAHLWQQHFGHPSRANYHNKEWANEMIRVGLVPSDTGQPGGKKTGQHMTHYIQDDGLFAQCCSEFLGLGMKLEWGAVNNLEGIGQHPRSKVKYTCSVCQQNAWAKPHANLICGHCNLQMEMEDLGLE